MTTATKPVIMVALVTFALLATVTPPFTSRNAGATTTTWAKTYGGAGSDIAYSGTPTSDGGYVVAGRTSSFGAGSSDAWVFKLDATGAIIWQKTYGGPASGRAWSGLAAPGPRKRTPAKRWRTADSSSGPLLARLVRAGRITGF